MGTLTKLCHYTSSDTRLSAQQTALQAPHILYGFSVCGQQIGKLMKTGQADEAETKKREVEGINEVADSAEEAFNKVGPGRLSVSPKVGR